MDNQEEQAKIIMKEDGSVNIEGNFKLSRLIALLENELIYQKEILRNKHKERIENNNG